MNRTVCGGKTFYFLMLWESLGGLVGGWVLYQNRKVNFRIVLLDPELLNPTP